MASANVMSGLPALLAEIGHVLVTGVRDVYRDFAEISFKGPQASLASKTALAVVISTGIACAMHLPEVWWAAISAIMCSQATRPASVRKGILRIIGTVAGAALSLALVGWIAYDHAACSLVLLTVATVGVLGIIVSPHGYAWLLGAITFVLVVLMSLANPLDALNYASFRVIEVCVGTLTAMAVAIALAPPGGDSAPAPPGWTNLLGERWPAVLHALRGGIAVALIPYMWDWLEISDIAPVAVTIAAVMAAPVLADHPLDDGRQIVQKALHRLIGCLLGGIPALLLLGLSFDSLVPWLGVLSIGIWLFAWQAGSQRGTGYVGNQALLVFAMTIVQGEGPPGSIMPGINRLIGIVLGMTVLFGVCLIVQPAPPEREPAAPR
ncbi:MAG: FUSC family protein [Alphaproteobacteria bacterium]|nr:FUSC family protein [Alphaproteobacteria bacterium]